MSANRVTQGNLPFDFDELLKVAESARSRHKVPGAALGLLVSGASCAAGLGVTSVENPLPVTPDTLFQVGSISKTFVGTAVMRMMEAGKLGLDVPLRAYLPEFRLSDADASARVTLRHCLTHMGGWYGDDFGVFEPGDDALANYVTGMALLPQETPLGTVWAYNNAGFSLAGRAMEVVTGKPFETIIQELILTPLGMTHTFFTPEDVMTHRFAVGHSTIKGEARVARPWPVTRAARPAGGVVSCIDDMLRYARFHMGDGVTPDGMRLLRPETMALMQSAQVAGANFCDFVGLPWLINDVGGVRLVGHTGSVTGQTAILRFLRDRDFAFIMLTNSDDGSKLYRHVLNWVLSRALGIQAAAVTTADHEPSALAEYAGRYETTTEEVTLTAANGGLTATVIDRGGFPTKDSPPTSDEPTTLKLRFYDRDRVVVEDAEGSDRRADFIRDADGQIAFFRFSGRLHHPMK